MFAEKPRRPDSILKTVWREQGTMSANSLRVRPMASLAILTLRPRRIGFISAGTPFVIGDIFFSLPLQVFSETFVMDILCGATCQVNFSIVLTHLLFVPDQGSLQAHNQIARIDTMRYTTIGCALQRADAISCGLEGSTTRFHFFFFGRACASILRSRRSLPL